MFTRAYIRFGLMGVFLCWALTPFMVASAQSVDHIKILPAGAQTDITLFVTDIPAPPNIFVLEGDNPRLVIDFKTATSKFSTQRHLPGAGHVKMTRHAKRGKMGIRIVFDLHDGGHLLSKTIKDDEILIAIGGPPLKKVDLQTGEPKARNSFDQFPLRPAPKRLQAIKARYFANEVPHPRLQPKISLNQKGETRLPVIVIDAGHGGRDPGALGGQGTQEKNITLSAAKELQRQLLEVGRYDVVLTRSTDLYVDHADRVRRAREGQADLFVSIHADSSQTSKTRGASVYTLSDRAKGRSKKIIDSQNWIMDVNLEEQSDPVGDILVDLAQRKTRSQSAQFADILIRDLTQTTQLVGNSHRRAGYFVLLAPDVPAVLLELGFLSHRGDEALLRTETHRRKLMRSVTRSVNQYFNAIGM